MILCILQYNFKSLYVFPGRGGAAASLTTNVTRYPGGWLRFLLIGFMNIFLGDCIVPFKKVGLVFNFYVITLQLAFH